MPRPPRVLACVSHHGLGHLAQVGPVLRALRVLRPDATFIVRCTAPLARQEELLALPFTAVQQADDFGLLMAGSLDVRRQDTLAAYRALHATLPAHSAATAAAIATLRPDVIIANAGYLPLLAARHLGVPGVLLASFTWAHALAAYCEHGPELDALTSAMFAAYGGADLHLAPEPSLPMPELPLARAIGPIARLGRCQPDTLRARLGLDPGQRVVLLFMGGVPTPLPLADWPRAPKIAWVVSHSERPRRPDMYPPGQTGLDWPDLLASADALVTKPGYGSITEAACNGVPVAYVRRGAWPEEPGLLAWLGRHGRGVGVSREALERGDLEPALSALWAQSAPPRPQPTGAEAAAAAIAGLLP